MKSGERLIRGRINKRNVMEALYLELVWTIKNLMKNSSDDFRRTDWIKILSNS